MTNNKGDTQPNEKPWLNKLNRTIKLRDEASPAFDNKGNKDYLNTILQEGNLQTGIGGEFNKRGSSR